jgi:hypothetical protein
VYIEVVAAIFEIVMRATLADKRGDTLGVDECIWAIVTARFPRLFHLFANDNRLEHNHSFAAMGFVCFVVNGVERSLILLLCCACSCKESKSYDRACDDFVNPSHNCAAFHWAQHGLPSRLSQ